MSVKPVSKIKQMKLLEIAHMDALKRINIENTGGGRQKLGCLIYDAYKPYCLLRNWV